MEVSELPLGSHPPALQLPHFPTRQQAFIWRNWEMVPAWRLAHIIGASETDVLQLAGQMGLPVPPQVSPHWLSSGYVTIIRQNWHLLPYEQLLQLLGWTAAQLDSALREDDFLWVKLGRLKPRSEPIRYASLTAEEYVKTARLKDIVQRHFGDRAERAPAPFAFLKTLQTPEIPERLTPAVFGENEVNIDGLWSLDMPQGDLGLARLGTEMAINSFVTIHEARWGVRLNSGGGDGPRIELLIDKSEQLPRESHAIEIAKERVVISAIDAAGWRRGLQWLEDTMFQRGGPYLPLGRIARRTRFDLRLSYPYCGVYGDTLVDPESDLFPDGLLARLSKLGVNGLWLQGLFSKLYPWDLAPEMSVGWENRLANLSRLADHAAAYGIGLYLYTNEPRALPEATFEKYPDLRPLRGVTNPVLGVAAVCTSHPATIDFLRNATAHIFNHVPQLAGLFAITLSENPTSCFSHGMQAQCPRCKDRTLTDAVSENNSVIAEGAWSSQPAARVIAYTWGADWPLDCIDNMPAGIEIMTVSEEHVPTKIGGIEGSVIDYSMGQIGPGPKALETWQRGKAHGNPTIAKMQINNTWECSAVPYIPVPDLVEEHLDRVERVGVTGLMLGWTLGGYPAGNLEPVSQHFWDDSAAWASGTQVAPRKDGEPVDLDAYAEKRFGAAAAPAVRAAWRSFSEAFVEYPYALGTLNVAPFNYGPMNILYAQSTGYDATMVGLPYDDLKNWSDIYPAEVYEKQCRLLSEGWAAGLAQLKRARHNQTRAVAHGAALPIGATDALTELENVANAVYLHFRSTYLQAAFVRTRDALAVTPEGEQGGLWGALRDILDEEIELAKQLHDIAAADSRIGYEASNHYYYALHDFHEKVINCEYLRDFFGL